MIKNVSVIILASGRGSRMGYKTPKPLLKIGGISFIQQILNRIDSLPSITEIIITESPTRLISKSSPQSKHPLHYAVQNAPNGPATAFEAGLKMVSPQAEHILLLLGDAPLIQSSSIISLLSTHLYAKNDMTILVGASTSDIPFGKVSLNNDQISFTEPGESKDINTLYSLGPIVFEKDQLTDSIHSLIESQGEEKRIEPLVSLYNSQKKLIGVCEVPIGNTLYWNINNRIDLYRARSL
jgi:bifunctional UDP-N-acetylglucosamine pyrophosphorylase/glucosamine-1-phosphate N-acetyltransferase